ncbi:MAG: AEC family transporter [Dehalococcoidales bacterium]|nr:AEC family transporter [Dehalococcoidales bacterium]
MDVLLITFQAVIALLGIGVLGFWIIGRKRIPGKALGLLNSIAIDIALPCLVLSNILAQFSPEKYAGWWQMPLWWLGFTLVALVLALLASLLVGKEFRGEFATGLLYQNGIFFPLLIITGLFSQPSGYIAQLFLFIFLQPSIVFSTYPLFYPGRPPEERVNVRRILNPVLIFTVIGLILGLVGVKQYVPGFVSLILVMVGGMAAPLFMLILGGNVYNDFKDRKGNGRRIYSGEVIKFTLVKNILFPLVFLGILLLIRPDYPLALIIILQASVPPITAIPIFAERSNGNRALAGQFIVASFVASILTIPAVIVLFSRFFPFPG